MGCLTGSSFVIDEGLYRAEQLRIRTGEEELSR
jgi:hypothetical protein